MATLERALERLKNSQSERQGASARSVRRARTERSPVAPNELPAAIGTIELARLSLAAQGYLPPEDQQYSFGEQLRHIKRTLVSHAFGVGADLVEDGHVVVVTSSVAGEGKTFCSLNIGLSMAAEQEFNVVLIDADLVNPKLSSLLRINNEPGLIDAVRSGDSRLESVLRSTDVPGLFVVGAGRRDGREAELMTSTRFQDYIAALTESLRGNLVLLDSAPVCETSGARALAGFAGQLALVVRAGRTPRASVLHALELLDGVEPVNLILNQVTMQQTATYGSVYQSAATAAPKLELQVDDAPRNDLL